MLETIIELIFVVGVVALFPLFFKMSCIYGRKKRISFIEFIIDQGSVDFIEQIHGLFKEFRSTDNKYFFLRTIY